VVHPHNLQHPYYEPLLGFMIGYMVHKGAGYPDSSFIADITLIWQVCNQWREGRMGGGGSCGSCWICHCKLPFQGLYYSKLLGTKGYDTFSKTILIRLILYFLQYLEKIMDGYRLAPPPGCPREIYHIMIQCWLVTLHQWWIVFELLFNRHPDPKARPSSEALVRLLLKSDRMLLHKDKMVASEANILGKPLSCGEKLYEDLQKLHVID